MTTDDARLSAQSSFEGETFDGLAMVAADLRGKEFSECRFKNVKLPQSRWANARLEDCLFESCDLTGLLPAQLRLHGAKFEHCKLLGVDWTHLAEFPVMEFTDCNLSYCTFASITARKTLFTRCVLVEASFEKSDFMQSTFEDCQLAGARFQDCNLERTSFSGSRDLLLNPASNRVRGASIPMDAAVSLAKSFGFKISG